MRKLFLSAISYFLFSFSIVCQIEKVEDILIIENEKNIHDIVFGKGNNLFVLNSNKQVEKINIDLITQPNSFDVLAHSMGISNSAEIIAFGKADGTLLFFDDKGQIKEYKAHNKKISFITFCPSDIIFATSGLDSKIKIWSAKTYDLLQEIDVKSGVVTDIKFSLDEKYLVYSTNKGRVIVWNIKDKRIHFEHKTRNKWISNIAICPDSVRYAICEGNKKISIFSFNNDLRYQLKKSHKNIITKIQFIDQNNLLSIGHDNRIVMSNINIPTEKAVIKHFKGYPRYKKRLFNLQGDKYLSSLSVSNDKEIVAISSYGKGIALTDYFHDLIENSHEIIISEVNKNKVDNISFMSELIINKNPGMIKGRITNPEEIRNAWLYYRKEDKMAKLKVNNDGEFQFQVVVSDEADYSIIIEDWNKDMKTVQYDFRVFKGG